MRDSDISVKLITVWDDRYSVDAASTNSTLKQARVVFHSISGAHLARRERGGGFCTFNFLAGGYEGFAERLHVQTARVALEVLGE